MLKFNRKGQIKVQANKQAVVDRLNKKVDTDYFSDNQHRWPANNIEFSTKSKVLYGKVTEEGFYISGKKKLFSKGFGDIEIRGRMNTDQNLTIVDYDINSKPQNLVMLIIINVALILTLLLIPSAAGLESEKMKGYIGIPVLLVFLNISIPLDLKKKLRQGELKLNEIITTLT